MVGASDAEQVVGGEGEILRNRCAFVDLRGHEAGDVEDDFLVVDGGDAPRARAYLDGNGGGRIGEGLHPGIFA